MKECKNCGHQCYENAKFCTKCAYSFSEIIPTTQGQRVHDDEPGSTDMPDIETLPVESVEDYKALYEKEAREAREREVLEAEEYRKKTADEARQDELERIERNKQKKAQETKGNYSQGTNTWNTANNTIINKEKTDTWYSVSLPVGSVNVPKFCNCCMAATSEMENIRTSSTTIGGTIETTRTVGMVFPICSECKEHRQEIRKKKILLSTLPIIVGIILTVIMIAANLTGVIGFITIIIAGMLFCFLGLIIKTRGLSVNHTAWENSVLISLGCAESNHVNYTFSNRIYAELLAYANNTYVIEQNKRNQTKTNRLLFSLARPVANCVLVFFVVAFTSFPTFISGLNLNDINNTRVASTPTPPLAPAPAAPAAPIDPVPAAPAELVPAAPVEPAPMPAIPNPFNIGFNQPAIAFPPNGYSINHTGKLGYAPFKVVTPPPFLIRFCYVLLRSVPENEAAISLFIHGGETVEILVPPGRYRMYFATGNVWYGTEFLFGPDTVYSKVDTILDFHETDDGFIGHTIEFNMLFGGNLSTSSADETDFHGVPSGEPDANYDITPIPAGGGILSVDSDTIFWFIPDSSGSWEFLTSDNGESDPFIVIFDSDGNIIAEDDDSGDGLNAHVTVDLEEGLTYIVFALCLNDSTDGFLMSVTKE